VTKFRHLPAIGRIIIVAVAFGVFAIAAGACATSYNAIYHLVDLLGLYGAGITKTFPGLVDFAFIVAESAAILGGIMRAVTRSEEVTKGWPYTTMWLCGLCTIAFNVWHAYLIGGRHDPLTVPRCIVASLPPILMMCSFQVLISIVKWVMLHLGRPLNSAAALTPTDAPGLVAGPMYGTPGGSVPGMVWAQVPAGYLPSAAQQQTPQNGHASGAGELTEETKRQQVETYLASLDPGQLQMATRSQVAADMTARGVPVDESYAGRILGEWRSRRGSGRAGGRKPRR
jgi:hypothetical protein